VALQQRAGAFEYRYYFFGSHHGLELESSYSSSSWLADFDFAPSCTSLRLCVKYS
jgi:hypothetical protein